MLKQIDDELGSSCVRIDRCVNVPPTFDQVKRFFKNEIVLKTRYIAIENSPPRIGKKERKQRKKLRFLFYQR